MSPPVENFDQQEKYKFNMLGDSWWDPKGPLNILHDINPTRLKYIETYTKLINKKVLDVGCGGGILTEAIALKNNLVTGIDIGEDLLEIATGHAQQTGVDIEYVCATVENFLTAQPIRNNSYDVITCMELLEHVPDPSSVINSCRQLLKPNGSLFLSTINRNIQAYLQTKIVAEYLFKLLPMDTHEYSKYSLPSEVASWCRDAGFEVIDVSGFFYIPFLRRAYIKDKPDVHYFLYARAC